MGQSLNPASIICGSFLEKLLNLFHVALPPYTLRIIVSLFEFEKGMVTHSSIPAWRIPWTEEPGGLQSMALQRVGHD